MRPGFFSPRFRISSGGLVKQRVAGQSRYIPIRKVAGKGVKDRLLYGRAGFRAQPIAWGVGTAVLLVGGIVTGLWMYIGSGKAAADTSGIADKAKDFFKDNQGLVLLIGLAVVMLIYSRTKKPAL